MKKVSKKKENVQQLDLQSPVDVAPESAMQVKETVDKAPETALQAPIDPAPATATQLSVFDVLQRRMERESTY